MSKARSHPGYVFSRPDTFTIHKDTSWQDYSGTKDLRVVRHRVRRFLAPAYDSGQFLSETTATGGYRMSKKPVCREWNAHGGRKGRCSGGGGMAASGWTSSCPGSLDFHGWLILVFTDDTVGRGTGDYGVCTQWSRDRNWFFFTGNRIVEGFYSMELDELRKALGTP